MKKLHILGALGLSFTLLTAACFRSETSDLVVKVPQMKTEMDARIVTNAALNEVVGHLDVIRNECEVDLENSRILYHESQRLLSPEYHAHIVSSLNEVGFEAEVLNAGFNPIPARRMPDGTILQNWPNRFSAIISVPEMDSTVEANIVVDAIGFARFGGDDWRVSHDPADRILNVVYNNVALSQKNIEEAIACTGYQANTMPPKEAPQGWDCFRFAVY